MWHRLPSVAAVALLAMSCGSDAPPTNWSSAGNGARKPVITQALIPAGRYGRHKRRPMRPRYITVHSTQNFSRGANARTHARMLQRGALKGRHNSLGYITWHFTVDDHSVYQSLPTNERGEHADYEGPGNRYSIGIEMCENTGNSRSRTVDRCAQLVAWLMKEHRIPLQNVVPHYHWNRVRYSDGKVTGHKNCPHFLLDRGRPGRKWQGFLSRVKSHTR